VRSSRCCSRSPPASAQSLAERPFPTGDWYGLRSTLLTHGVALHATYTSDVVSNLSGSINRRTIYFGNLDLTLTCHLQALTGVPAGTLFIYGIADPDVDQFLSYTGAGAVYTGLIPRRDGDTLGSAVAAAHNGDPFIVKLKSPGPHNRGAGRGGGVCAGVNVRRGVSSQKWVTSSWDKLDPGGAATVAQSVAEKRPSASFSGRFLPSLQKLVA